MGLLSCFFNRLFCGQVRDGCFSSSGNKKEQATKVSVEGVTCLSDSPSKHSERHQPVEVEADLASLLLAKEPFCVANIVHDSVDPDYAFLRKF